MNRSCLSFQNSIAAREVLVGTKARRCEMAGMLRELQKFDKPR